MAAPRPPVLISVEGNIGSGKSTLLRALESHNADDNVQWITEPHWEVGEYDLLALFNGDPARWAFPMQMNCLLTRMKALQAAAASSAAVVVMERSMLSDRIFAEVARDNGTITGHEFAVYEKLHAHAVLSTPPLAGIIHVTTPSAECADRIAARGTPSESGMPLTYLLSLERVHRQHIGAATVPVVALDGSHADPEAVTAFIKAVHEQQTNKRAKLPNAFA